MDGSQDWKDASQYPKSGDSLTSTQWAWEFLRRNKEYRNNFIATEKIADEIEKRDKCRLLSRSYGLTIGLPNPWTFNASEIADDRIFDNVPSLNFA